MPVTEHTANNPAVRITHNSLFIRILWGIRLVEGKLKGVIPI